MLVLTQIWPTPPGACGGGLVAVVELTALLGTVRDWLDTGMLGLMRWLHQPGRLRLCRMPERRRDRGTRRFVWRQTNSCRPCKLWSAGSSASHMKIYQSFINGLRLMPVGCLTPVLNPCNPAMQKDAYFVAEIYPCKLFHSSVNTTMTPAELCGRQQIATWLPSCWS